jgi:hypothetical protein
MLYLNGEGMHVAANAVTRQLGGLEASPAWRASYFFDEVFSHVVSDVGLIGISLAVLALAARLPSRRAEPAVAAAAIPFGFAWFADGVEGGTVALMLPAALVALATILVRARGRPAALARNPVLLFYGTAFSLAGVLFLAWRLWQGGFPEFSQLGWV